MIWIHFCLLIFLFANFPRLSAGILLSPPVGTDSQGKPPSFTVHTQTTSSYSSSVSPMGLMQCPRFEGPIILFELG